MVESIANNQVGKKLKIRRNQEKMLKISSWNQEIFYQEKSLKLRSLLVKSGGLASLHRRFMKYYWNRQLVEMKTIYLRASWSSQIWPRKIQRGNNIIWKSIWNSTTIASSGSSLFGSFLQQHQRGTFTDAWVLKSTFLFWENT